ncbi:MAG: TraB family protein, partial [Methanobacterium sp.]|nr:TraB family protein [Methanobacterium sp.]
AWEKIKFTYGIIYSFFSGEDEIDDIESLKKGDALQEVMNYFQEMSPQAYKVLVDERDAYMSHKLLEIPEDNVIAVIGAGHQQGINNYLDHPENLPPLNSLLNEKKSGVPWIKILLSLIPLSFIIIFILAFIRGINIQSGLIQFILLTGGLSFLGSILSGSKILSAVTAFLVAPITSLHPLIAAGWFAGLVEAKLRHVGSSDLVGFGKCEDLTDLWNNKIFRVLLVVVGANLGSMIGSFITIPQVILPLFGKLWGG